MFESVTVDGQDVALYVNEVGDNSYIYRFTMPGHDVNVSAVFAVLYKITYELDGGRFEGVRYLSYMASTETFTLTEPTRDGYTFAGWTGSNGITPQTTVTIPKGSTGDMSYTANWTANTYSITYNLDGGSLAGGVSNPATYTIETDSFTLTNPTKDGYTFTGWTGSNGSTPQTAVTIAKGSTGTKTFTANFTANNYTVKFSANDGDGEMDSQSYTYDADAEALTANAFTRKGYTFTGWTGTGLDGAAMTVEIPKGTTGNLTYTATWEEEILTPSVKYQSMTLGSKLGLEIHVIVPENCDTDNWSIVFDVSGDKSNIQQPYRIYSEVSNNRTLNYAVFKCYVTSVQISDPVTATLTYDDGRIMTYTTRAVNYLDLLLERENTLSADLIELARCVKDFGHYVQPVLAAENNWELGVKHAHTEKEYDYNNSDFTSADSGTKSHAVTSTRTSAFRNRTGEFCLNS